jgi:hypothetical protein
MSSYFFSAHASAVPEKGANYKDTTWSSFNRQWGKWAYVYDISY